MIMKRIEDDEEEEEKEVPRHTAFAIDWLEYRAVILWEGYRFNRWFTKLEDAKRKAKEFHVDEVPIQIGQQHLLLAASGMGRGRQSHFEYLFKIGPILFAVSGRESKNIKHPNLYVKLSGEACLLYGVTQCRNIVDQVVAELGGQITEDGVSRIDLCLDVAEMGLNDGLQQACEQRHVRGGILKNNNNAAFYGMKRTGFTLGSKTTVMLNVYDKLVQSRKKDGLYLHGMKKHRWNGCFPSKAIRIEYQISRSWLRGFGLVQVDDILNRLPDIVEKLTSTESYPLCVITESVPDSKNHNQQRSGVHPLWQWLVEQFSALAGKPVSPLERVSRDGTMQLDRLYAMTRGMLTTAAAQLGMYCDSANDACNVLMKLAEGSQEASDEWSKRYISKAIQAGTFQDLTSFEFGTLSEPPEESEGDFE